MRNAAVDTVLPLGGGVDGLEPLFVGKGCSVGYSVYGLHRRHDIWGEDANDFRPERWIDLKTRRWEFLPYVTRLMTLIQLRLDELTFIVLRFNGGPRACLARKLPPFPA